MSTPDKRFHYTTLADRFDELMNPYDLQRRLEIVFDELLPDDLNRKLVLDVGCGSGWFSHHASRRDATVFSVDMGTPLLQKALEKASIRPAVADALALPFAASSFDYVISSEVIEHTLNPALAVKEMARVLRPNGVLVLTCPNRRWQWLVTGASRLGLRPFDGIEDFPTFGQLEIFAAGAGLSLVCHRGFHPWPFQLRLLWPLSRALDRALGASAAGRWMINQAIRAVKSPA